LLSIDESPGGARDARRSGIEPVIGRAKNEYRMDRNYQRRNAQDSHAARLILS
jgi:hypothetical protein